MGGKDKKAKGETAFAHDGRDQPLPKNQKPNAQKLRVTRSQDKAFQQKVAGLKTKHARPDWLTYGISVQLFLNGRWRSDYVFDDWSKPFGLIARLKHTPDRREFVEAFAGAAPGAARARVCFVGEDPSCLAAAGIGR